MDAYSSAIEARESVRTSMEVQTGNNVAQTAGKFCNARMKEFNRCDREIDLPLWCRQLSQEWAEDMSIEFKGNIRYSVTRVSLVCWLHKTVWDRVREYIKPPPPQSAFFLSDIPRMRGVFCAPWRRGGGADMPLLTLSEHFRQMQLKYDNLQCSCLRCNMYKRFSEHRARPVE